MKIEKINIEDGLYASRLLQYLWYKKPDNDFTEQIIQVLRKLINKNLIKGEHEDSELSFSDTEIDILNRIDITAACENKEIVARWCDYIQELDKVKRPTYIKQCYANYLEIYKATGNHEYLIRRLQLIRKAKGLFTNDLEEIYSITKKEVVQCDKPYRQKQLLTELAAIFKDERCQNEFSNFLEETIELYNNKGNYNNSRFCLKSARLKTVQKSTLAFGCCL